MKKVIMDASPLIFISKADLLGVFKKMYEKVYMTPSIFSEIEWPLKHGIKAPEVRNIKNSNIVKIEELSAKEIMQAKKLASEHSIGKGEAEAAVLFQRGGYENVIVADVRAHRKLKE